MRSIERHGGQCDGRQRQIRYRCGVDDTCLVEEQWDFYSQCLESGEVSFDGLPFLVELLIYECPDESMPGIPDCPLARVERLDKIKVDLRE